MGRSTLWLYSWFLLLVVSSNTLGLDNGRELNLPPSPRTQELVGRAVLLAEKERPRAAVAALKKALSISPNYLRAHIEYINIRANFLEQRDQVETEYQYLIHRNPRNPIYIMALYYRSNGEFEREFLHRVVQLAPEWAWGHYAKALLIKGNDPEGAAIEFGHCIKKDGSAKEAYDLLIELQETRLNRIDDAIRTAERLAAQKGIRATLRFSQLWRLRLVKAQKSTEAKIALRNELAELASHTKEVYFLRAIRSAYLDFLEDSEGARAIEHQILQVDPTWTPQRGWLYTQVKVNQSGVPRYVVLVNRQISIQRKVREISNANEIEQRERIRRLEDLLHPSLSNTVLRIIYEEIFRLAIRSNSHVPARKYGKALHLMDPDDSALLSQIAIVLANEKDHMAEAFYFARKAETLTKEFQGAKRPRNMPQSIFDNFFPQPEQREAYKKNRGRALDALGWVLVQMGDARKGELLLRKAVEIEQLEGRLLHLANALQKLGRLEEAAVIKGQATTFLTASIRRKLTTEPVADLQLESIEGQRFRLSDLKGKVIVINFWAASCIPCIHEMPSLKKLYGKYKEKGLEILSVSTDDDSSKVRQFVSMNKLPFPVLNYHPIGKVFGVEAVPANLFIDRQGKLRYRKIGFEDGDEREIEVVVVELLK